MRNFIIACLLLFSMVANAQDSTKASRKNSILVGIESGPAFSDLRGHDIEKDELMTKTYFSVGVYTGYNFNSKFSLITGLYYDRKGAKWDLDDFLEGDEIFGDFKAWEKFNYLTLPLYFRYTRSCRRINFHINAGPYISWLMKQESVMEFDEAETFIYDDKENYKDFDFGVSAGIGISKNLGSKWLLSLELRDNLGLTNIYDPVEEEDFIYEDAEKFTLYTNSINIMVGAAYRFNCKK